MLFEDEIFLKLFSRQQTEYWEQVLITYVFLIKVRSSSIFVLFYVYFVFDFSNRADNVYLTVRGPWVFPQLFELRCRRDERNCIRLLSRATHIAKQISFSTCHHLALRNTTWQNPSKTFFSVYRLISNILVQSNHKIDATILDQLSWYLLYLRVKRRFWV